MTSRRSFIKVLAALPPALSFRAAWAAGPATPDASRLALVIGNSSYQEAPLVNPANDAKAIAGLFTQAGFSVDSRLDANRADMMAAIERFGAAAKRPDTKLVVFYYAGHGAQLDWRNYLLPVDAVVRKQADMKERCVDLSLLLGQLSAARDKTFVIILDACRNNPFGSAYRPEQKGLSQFDAPVGSLLAYATAPGSVASDGDGQNGLYTENLVRELSRRDTRIEDALKRVRLNVRLASKGDQIPWETTSLEGDVFIFNEGQKALSETELEKLVEADVTEWARIKSSKKIDDWVSYLRSFPNGRFAEIAQMRLARLLAEDEKREAEKRLREEQRIQEEQRKLAEQQRLEQERIERERLRLAEEQHQAALRKQREEQQLQEMQRRQEEQKTLAAKRRFEEQRLLAEQQRLELQRLEQQRIETERLAAERRRSEDEQRRAEQEKLALAKPAAASTIEIKAGVAVPLLIAPSANPFSAGRYALGRIFTVGDFAAIQVTDILTGIEERTRKIHVTRVDYDEDRVEYNNGVVVSDLMGNLLKQGPAEFDTPVQWTPAEFQLGKKWTAAFRQTRGDKSANAYYDMQIVRREVVNVPAGSFDTFSIEGNGWNTTKGFKLELKLWLVPGINFPIKREMITRNKKGGFRQSERHELVALSQHAKGRV